MGLTLLAKPSPRVVIVALRSHYPRLVKELLECGCLHPSGEGEERLRVAARRLRGEIDLLASRIREVLARIGGKGGGEVRITVSEKLDEDVASLVTGIADLAEKVEALVSRLVELTTPGSEAWKTIELLRIYSFIDVDLSRLASSSFIRARLFRVHVKQGRELEEEASRVEGLVLVREPAVEKDYDLYAIVYPAALEEKVEELVRRLRLQELSVPEGLPANIAEALRRLTEEVEKLPKEASKYAGDLERALRALEAASQLLRLLESTRLYENFAIIEGNVSRSEAGRLKERLDRALGGAYLVVGIEAPAREAEEEPTEYRYPALLRPIAELIEMYGHPKPYEIVPLALTAVTLPIIFGMMFPDLGHGMILALVGLYFLLRGGESGRWLGLLVLYMAASAMVFGFLAGEFFGVHPAVAGWLNQIWHGHPPYASPVHPIAETILEGGAEEAGAAASILVLKSSYISLGLGALLLTVAAWTGFAKALVRGEREELVASLGKALTFTGVLTVFLGAFAISGWEGYNAIAPIVTAMGVPLGVPVTPEAELYGRIALALALGGLALTFLAPVVFGHEEGIGMRVIGGVMEVFDTILLAVGNTVSFIRIMGLMLAHSSLVFGFLLIGLTSGPAWPAVYALGNLLVIALESLIATAHTLRLHFYEMYSKFYEDGGVAYQPAKLPKGVVIEVRQAKR